MVTEPRKSTLLKRTKVAALLAVLLCTLCACMDTRAVRTIPLLRVNYSGECGLCEWQVGEGKIVDMETPLFVNAQDHLSLLYTFWDGNRFILRNPGTKVVCDASMPVTFGAKSHEAYYQDYVLWREEDHSYTLERESENWHFRLDSTVSIDGLDKRADELWLSGFLVDGTTICMLLNTFSFTEGTRLYVCEASYIDGTSQIHEVQHSFRTMSAATLPVNYNVIPTDHSFLVLSETVVYDIMRDTWTAREVFDISAARESRFLRRENKRSYLIRRIGWYDSQLVLTVVADMQTPSEATYLLLIDKGDIIAAIRPDSEWYAAPNLWVNTGGTDR